MISDNFIKIDRFDTQTRFELAAQCLAPRLGAEDAAMHRQLPQVDPHSIGDLGNIECVGRRRAQNASAKITQQANLPFGASAGDRHHGAA
jgi:hypothetical protein